jgi:hypothetical protein
MMSKVRGLSLHTRCCSPCSLIDYSRAVIRSLSTFRLSPLLLAIALTLLMDRATCFPVMPASFLNVKPPNYVCFTCHTHYYTFSRRSLFQSRTSTNIDTSTSSSSSSSTNDFEEELSEVDTRVLRAMLQEQKLNLDTEEDVRKLLERGTVKTAPKQQKTSKKMNELESSEYSSKILKTLTDTKLWKKVSAKAGNALESVGIWVTNKIEQDVKVIAALGVFTWDRVTRDVARALPAARNAAKKQLLTLSNSSSYVAAVLSPNALMEDENQSQNFVQEMNRPEDEIKSVSRDFFSILSGERTAFTSGTSATTGRGLRTVAPAGTANSAERQRRALQQRRKLEQAKKSVTNIGGSVVDTAWELRRELKAEINVPGYKTEPIRSAIAAGVVATGNILNGVREEARLNAAKRQELFIQESQTDSSSTVPSVDNLDKQSNTFTAKNVVEDEKSTETELLLNEIRMERKRIVDKLTKCIDKPDESWLAPEVVASLDNTDFIASKSMQDCLTKMILLRDEIANPSHDEILSFLEYSVNDLVAIRTAIEYLCSFTASEISEIVAAEIGYEIMGRGSESDYEEPLILRIEEALISMQEMELHDQSIQEATSKSKDPVETVEPNVFSPEIFDVIPDAVFIDVIPDAFMMDTHESFEGESTDDGVGAGLIAEIVSEDDFENAVGAAKNVFEVQGDEDSSKKEERNPVIIILLRSLDVAFFISEKAFTVGIPGTILLVKTALTRLDEINRLGLGSEGWKKLCNIANAKGRY